MKKMIVMWVICALLCSGIGLLACGGGGGEKQAGQEPESKTAEEEVAANKELIDKELADAGDAAGGSRWKDIPIYSGATRHDSEMAARMSATMSGMHEGGSSEIQIFKTGDDYDKVVSYYKALMPRRGWKKITDKEEEEGWGSMWQKKDGEFLVNVSVVKDIEGECGIIIGRHEGVK